MKCASRFSSDRLRIWPVLGWLLWLATAGLISARAMGQTSVVYPRAESAGDARSSYPIALLKLSLEKSAGLYTLRPSDITMQQTRSLRLLAGNGGLIDVVWTVTSKERENEFLPIRIPIDRGLIGWRLLLIRKQDEKLFSGIDNVHTLATLRAGQGHDWPDTDVLLTNQLNVMTSSNYENLFSMLAAGHIQYFPRSVSEIFSEIEARPELGLKVEKNIVLHYPEALYFFVNKNNTALANAIAKGLRKAIADGSLQALFFDYYGASIARANLTNRHVISLSNPTLPEETPLSDSSLWFDPRREN